MLTVLLLAAPAVAQQPTSAEAITSMRVVGMLIGGAERCGVDPARGNEVAASAIIDMAQNWEKPVRDILAAALLSEATNTPKPKDCRTALRLFGELEGRLK